MCKKTCYELSFRLAKPKLDTRGLVSVATRFGACNTSGVFLQVRARCGLSNSSRYPICIDACQTPAPTRQSFGQILVAGQRGGCHFSDLRNSSLISLA